MRNNRKSEVVSRKWSFQNRKPEAVSRKSLTTYRLRLTVLLLTTYYLLLPTSRLYSGTPGTSGAQFLNIPVSARSASLGEAYTGYAEDGNIIEYNPAGLGNVYINEIWVSHLSYFDGVTLQSFTAAIPKRKFVFGLNGKYLNAKDTVRDVYGIDGNDFYIIDWSVHSGFAYKVTSEFFIGASIRNIAQKLKDEKSSGAAANLGIFTSMPKQKISLGAAVVNIGQGMKFVEDRDPLPLSLRLGGAWGFSPKATMLVEVIQPNDDGLRQRLGLEYHVREPLWIRAGWKINQQKFSDYTGFTSGFGLRFDRFCMDYAFIPHSDLGVSHYITLGFKFGKPLPLRKVAEEIPQEDEAEEPQAIETDEYPETDESSDTEEERP